MKKKRKIVKTALSDASKWNEKLSEKKRSKVSYSKARKQAVNKLFDQIKDLL